MNYNEIRKTQLFGGSLEPPLLNLIELFYQEQLKSWPRLQEGVLALASAKGRVTKISDDELLIKHIAHRMKSATAALAPEEIKKRPCFLCPAQIPTEQLGLSVSENFLLLCNPMPIFRPHFTVCCKTHRPQILCGLEQEFLKIAEKVGGPFVLFFNGAMAGASAPDHLHFQICPANDLPLIARVCLQEEQVEAKSKFGCQGGQFAGVCHLVFREASLEAAAGWLSAELNKLSAEREHGELLVNVYAYYSSGIWQIILVRRKKHRPSCYFAEGAAKRIISPACVELGGLVIAPRLSDYENLTELELKTIFEEVVACPP